MCAGQDNERTHRPVTADFLKYIDGLNDSTSTFLQVLVSTPPDDPLFPASDRQFLLTLRDFWRHIHQFVKPCRDADTLHSPVALIEQLEDHLAKLPGLDGVRLLISHTPEMNYFQFPRSVIRQRADDYAAIVPGSPTFPRKTALIAIPYSQESSLFPNLIICHEMGHFVFEEMKIDESLSPHLERAIEKHFPEMLTDPDQELNLAWCRQSLWSWAEEIYCDRFAIGLAGPAYSFSYIELFDVIGASEGDTVNHFFDTHPSDACRFSEHADQLSRGGWWPLLDRDGKSYAKLIRSMQAVQTTSYTFESDEKPQLAPKVLKAFLDLKASIPELVTRTFDGMEATFKSSTDLSCVDAIYNYFSWGVVPATLVRNKQLFRPEPTLLINAAYLFYLERVPTLIKRIKASRRERKDVVSQREKWAKRVEQWTLKALEDLRLPGKGKRWDS